MATHSSVLAWKIPGMGEPHGLSSMGSHRVGHDWSDLAAAAVLEGSEVTQLCPTFCDPMDCSLPDSSIHGVFQASILEWVAISSSKASSWPVYQSCFSWFSFIVLRLQLFRSFGFISPIWPVMIKYWPQTPSVLISSVFPTFLVSACNFVSWLKSKIYFWSRDFFFLLFLI